MIFRVVFLGLEAVSVFYSTFLSPPESIWTPLDSSGLYPKYSQVHIFRGDWSPLHSTPVKSSPVQWTPLKSKYSTKYSKVIYHSTPFFKLSLKIITDYSDVICHSTAYFELSLKM